MPHAHAHAMQVKLCKPNTQGVTSTKSFIGYIASLMRCPTSEGGSASSASAVPSNDGIHLNYDLVTKLALVMNTKVVHNDIINMFELFIRSHKHFIHWLHISLSRSTYIASLKDLIMQSDLHEHCSISHPKCG